MSSGLVKPPEEANQLVIPLFIANVILPTALSIPTGLSDDTHDSCNKVLL